MMPCVIAKGCDQGNGYRRHQRDGVRLGAHQWAWIDHHGPIPEGKMVLHTCDNRACENIRHLYIGDAARNQKDKSDRRRIHGRRNPNAKLTGPQVRMLRSKRNWRRGDVTYFADKLGVTIGCISHIKNGRVTA